MYCLYIATGLAMLASLIASRDKTVKAFKIGFRKFVKILPAFVIMLIFISVVLFLVPDALISTYLGTDNVLIGVIMASLFGSITLMPGFIAFPLCGILLTKGVSYMVLSTFLTTLMMVGVLTFPVEKEYLGIKVTIMRNTIGLLIALFVALATGIFFGEIFS